MKFWGAWKIVKKSVKIIIIKQESGFMVNVEKLEQ
jgi:hypothetical protein